MFNSSWQTEAILYEIPTVLLYALSKTYQPFLPGLVFCIELLYISLYIFVKDFAAYSCGRLAAGIRVHASHAVWFLFQTEKRPFDIPGYQVGKSVGNEKGCVLRLEEVDHLWDQC